MTEHVVAHTLEEVVAAYEQRRPWPSELRGCPLLVHCSAGSKPEATGYDTRAVMVPWDARVALALVRSGSRTDPTLLANAGALYPVEKRPSGPFPDRIGVGRSRTADIPLRLGSVSKYHAYFTFDAQQNGTLWDARSRNGTRVGAKVLMPGEGERLENGVQIVFGDEEFLFFTELGFRELVAMLAHQGPGR